MSALRWLACCVVVPAVAGAQQTARPTKSLTSAQVEYQREGKQWHDRHEALRLEARRALDAEAARDKAGDCPNADTTLAQEQCLTQETATTRNNYSAFLAAIRSMLADEYPKTPGEKPSPEVSGGPLSGEQQVAELDSIEAVSASYRKLAAQVAYDEFRGGTLAPVFELETEQKLLRLHLQELGFIYSEALASH